MAYKPREASCEYCKTGFMKKAATQRFCSIRCSNFIYSNNRSEEYKKKNAEQLRKFSAERKGDSSWAKKIGNSPKRRKRSVAPANIYDCSSRTRVKILKRLGVKCSKCGWHRATCDIHHIQGRKIEDANNHSNLTVLCPNHHREFHEGLISRSDIKSFEEEYGNVWLDHYFS